MHKIHFKAPSFDMVRDRSPNMWYNNPLRWWPENFRSEIYAQERLQMMQDPSQDVLYACYFQLNDDAFKT